MYAKFLTEKSDTFGNFFFSSLFSFTKKPLPYSFLNYDSFISFPNSIKSSITSKEIN